MEPKNSFASQVYDRIKKDIVELRLEPGAYFLAQEIADALGASRTPVREAVKRLEQDGWIVWESYRKARVKDVTLEDALDIFQTRKMIEPFCLNWIFDQGLSRLLAGKLDVIVSEMENLHHDWLHFLLADVSFHTTIVEEAGNKQINKIWQHLSSEITRIGLYGKTEERKTGDIVREHSELLQGLWDGDKNMVLARLADHHDKILASVRRKLRAQ